MTEQSKLLQQVEEIRRRAHVCPECDGEKTFFAKGVVSNRCWVCDGTGQVPAPDIDALAGAIEALAKYVEAGVNLKEHGMSLNEFVHDTNGLFAAFERTKEVAVAIVQRGLPGEEVNTEDGVPKP